MNQREIEETVHQILRQQACGEKLTRREEKILAYAYHASRRQRMVKRVELGGVDQDPE